MTLKHALAAKVQGMNLTGRWGRPTLRGCEGTASSAGRAGGRGVRRAVDAADPARAARREPPVQRAPARAAGIPRALLAQRLGSLQRAGLIERRPSPVGRGFEYHLSPAGMSFRPVVEALGRWGYQWAAEQLRPDNLDAGLLM